LHAADEYEQVNTSRESQKMGVMPEETVLLVQHMLVNCNNLKVIGIMTIGSIEQSTSSENNEFEVRHE